jgi:predicted regulator of Ras-like GTPase activity (Roadblock/LC7/MglB family)
LNSPIHNSLNRILEAQGVLDDKHEFFIAITAQPNINLGGVFLQTSECLRKIKTSLITSGESFKPPLIQFSSQKVQNIIEGFNVKENDEIDFKLSPFSLSFSKPMSLNLKKVLNNISHTVPDLKYAFITIEGGFIASRLLKNFDMNSEKLDKISAMSYSLFQTANRCAWLLKKMHAESILLDCQHSFQFIEGLGKAIFSAVIGKMRQKLGLIRLILPQFTNKINTLVREASEVQDFHTFDIKRMLGDNEFF